MPFFITCSYCHRQFESKFSQKLFCTRQCYQASPQFLAMLRENSKKVAERKRAKSQNGITERLTINCLNCDKEVFTKPSLSHGRSKHKYCSTKCYREYMAARFDRYIASPESLALPQNYDEFLTGDELHCLIEGCGWSGIALSQHMNFTHGIRKEKFKEMAGFNARTGVVTADYSQKLSDAKKEQGWGPEHMAHLRSLVRTPPVYPRMTKDRMRLEGKEHAAKGRALKCAPERLLACQGCGRQFSTTAYIKKYCTEECRTQTYSVEKKRIYDIREHDLICGVCAVGFKGTVDQQQRHDDGLIVVCSFSCRQKRAGHIARGTWTGR